MKKNLFVKILVAFFFCIGCCEIANAQNTFAKGDQNLNVGIGLGSVLGGSGYTTTLPPLSVSYEYGIKDNLFDEKSSLGIGAYLGYASNKQEWIFENLSYGYKYSYTIFGVRGILHYQLIDKFDTYGGLMLGYNNIGSKTYGDWGSRVTPAAASGLSWSLFIGGRYFFTDNIGAFAELGYGIAYLQLGVSLKF